MNFASIATPQKGRHWAAFLLSGALLSLSLLLSGCSAAPGDPVLSTLFAFLPGRADVSDRAARISYASVDFGVGGAGGLLILSEIGGDVTFWQSSRGETVVLRGGNLESTSGLANDLRMTEISNIENGGPMLPWQRPLPKPLTYQVTRSWTGSDGKLRTGRAQAELTCADAPEKVDLPLTKLNLQRCVERLSWQRGATTSSIFWRDPDSYHIWAGEVVAWPGSPVFDWKVARPWW